MADDEYEEENSNPLESLKSRCGIRPGILKALGPKLGDVSITEDNPDWKKYLDDKYRYVKSSIAAFLGYFTFDITYEKEVEPVVGEIAKFKATAKALDHARTRCNCYGVTNIDINQPDKIIHIYGEPNILDLNSISKQFSQYITRQYNDIDQHAFVKRSNGDSVSFTRLISTNIMKAMYELGYTIEFESTPPEDYLLSILSFSDEYTMDV